MQSRWKGMIENKWWSDNNGSEKRLLKNLGVGKQRAWRNFRSLVWHSAWFFIQACYENISGLKYGICYWRSPHLINTGMYNIMPTFFSYCSADVQYSGSIAKFIFQKILEISIASIFDGLWCWHWLTPPFIEWRLLISRRNLLTVVLWMQLHVT